MERESDRHLRLYVYIRACTCMRACLPASVFRQADGSEERVIDR